LRDRQALAARTKTLLSCHDADSGAWPLHAFPGTSFMSARLLLIPAVLALCPVLILAQPPAGEPRPAADLYKMNCQPCHMADGNAAIEAMNFADGKWKHGSSVADLVKTITNGVPGTAMVPFQGRFTEAEIAGLAKYVRTFDKNLKAAPTGHAKAKKKPS
jgi:mono/diheme cytochrome c family protein